MIFFRGITCKYPSSVQPIWLGGIEYTDDIFAEGQDLLNECPGYETKQFDGEAPVMLELWEMWSNTSLPSLLGPLRPKVVAPDKGPIYGSDRTV